MAILWCFQRRRARRRGRGSTFFPLTVDYREKLQAAGKIPGGRFYKREGRPTNKEVLTMRIIDRPLRPLFPEDYWDEVQIIAMVLSADTENDPDILSMIGVGGGAVHIDASRSRRRWASRGWGW